MKSTVKQRYGELLIRAPIDDCYYSTTLEGWNELLIFVYKDFKWPKYMSDRFDCDKFAFLLKALVAAYFGLNDISFTCGNSPLGYHAWNTLHTPDGNFDFEPQTAQIVTDYTRKEILI